MKKVVCLLSMSLLLIGCEETNQHIRGKDVDEYGFIARCNTIGYPRSPSTCYSGFSKKVTAKTIDGNETWVLEAGGASMSFLSNDELRILYNYKRTKSSGKVTNVHKEMNSYDVYSRNEVIDAIGFCPLYRCSRYVNYLEASFNKYIEYKRGTYSSFGTFSFYSSPLQSVHEFSVANYLNSDNEIVLLDCSSEASTKKIAEENNYSYVSTLTCFAEVEFDWDHGDVTYCYYKVVEKNSYGETITELLSNTKYSY